MSDLGLHKKALILLLDYYEEEQFDPSQEITYILESIDNVLKELQNLKDHILGCHKQDNIVDAMDDINELIAGILTDRRNLVRIKIANGIGGN